MNDTLPSSEEAGMIQAKKLEALMLALDWDMDGSWRFFVVPSQRKENGRRVKSYFMKVGRKTNVLCTTVDEDMSKKDFTITYI